MRWPRMTTRRWIDLAAFVVMLCLAILLLKQRRERFARLARLHASVLPAVDLVDLAIAPKTQAQGPVALGSAGRGLACGDGPEVPACCPLSVASCCADPDPPPAPEWLPREVPSPSKR